MKRMPHLDKDLLKSLEILLKNNVMLTDPVIYHYLKLLKKRDSRIECLDTLVLSTYNKKCYEAIRNTVKDCNVTTTSILFAPLHHSIHWTLLVAYIDAREIKIYDSIGFSKNAIDAANNLKRILANLQREASEWKIEFVFDTPKQKGPDCGVFLLAYAEFLSRGAALIFDNKHIRGFRNQIAEQIQEGHAKNLKLEVNEQKRSRKSARTLNALVAHPSQTKMTAFFF